MNCYILRRHQELLHYEYFISKSFFYFCFWIFANLVMGLNWVRSFARICKRFKTGKNWNGTRVLLSECCIWSCPESPSSLSAASGLGTSWRCGSHWCSCCLQKKRKKVEIVDAVLQVTSRALTIVSVIAPVQYLLFQAPLFTSSALSWYGQRTCTQMYIHSFDICLN